MLLERDLLKCFKIKFIRHNEGLYLSAVLDSKDNRYVINTKNSELFDKKTGKCWILDEETMDMINGICRYALVTSL